MMSLQQFEIRSNRAKQEIVASLHTVESELAKVLARKNLNAAVSHFLSN
jgi:hypothetical protein